MPTTSHRETNSADHVRIPFDELKTTLCHILVRAGMPEPQALICAGVFATNSLEGVYSHGVNRFPKFLAYLRSGQIKADSQAVCRHRAGSMEQWDGQSGPGPVNAFIAADRAMALARAYGMGCVALAHTNHWLRGGTYAWKAARHGFAYIAWSNTVANMPPWGAAEKKLGNNPIVIGTPGRRSLDEGSVPDGGDHTEEGEAIVLDMALSQYSFGALEIRKQNGEQLPYPGGYDHRGNLTTEPGAILESSRPLPIGYWKGSGLSLLLDILATLLSGGLSTAEITAQSAERNLSQVFICFDLTRLHNHSHMSSALKTIVDDYYSASPAETGGKIRYPGQHIAAIRKENLQHGVPVRRATWEAVRGA